MISQGEILRNLFKSAENISVRKLTQILEPLEITPNQSEVILVLGKYEPLSLKELGELLICEEKSPSRLVQALIKKELVEKKISIKDKRTSLLTLSEKGKTLLPKIIEIKKCFDQELLKQKIDFQTVIKSLETYVEGSIYEDKLKRRSLWTTNITGT